MKYNICLSCDKKIPMEGDWGDLYLGIIVTRGFSGGEWEKCIIARKFLNQFCCCPCNEPKNVEDLFDIDDQ